MTGFQETLVHPEVLQTLKEAPMDADLRAANQARIRQFIADQNAALLRTLRMYVLRAGLASGGATARTAEDLLNEVVVEALDHAERFNPAFAPMAWLLGIAANLIRRTQADLARHSRREPLARDLVTDQDDPLSDDDLFDRFAAMRPDGEDPAAALESDAAVTALLERVPVADRAILRLALIHELDGESLARALGVRPGAARVRLHRAIARL